MLKSADPHIHYHQQQAVLVIQIDRPEKKNALTRSMYRALANGLRQADADPQIRVILLRGAEDCFTSGNDVNDFVQQDSDEGERPSYQFMRALTELRKPLIAAVGGLAIGIGTTLLFHCDLVYAAEDSFLQLPFTRLGLCPEAGSSLLLPQMIGHQRACELLLLGDRITSAKARDYGIINEVLPTAGYLEYAMQKAQALAALPAEAVQVSKTLIKRQQQPLLDAVIDEELGHFTRLLRSDDAQQILQNFLKGSAK